MANDVDTRDHHTRPPRSTGNLYLGRGVYARLDCGAVVLTEWGGTHALATITLEGDAIIALAELLDMARAGQCES